jgi:hypothetical protein
VEVEGGRVPTRDGWLHALGNKIEELTLIKSTGDPFFDDSEEARQKLLMIVEKASHLATQSELEALIAE